MFLKSHYFDVDVKKNFKKNALRLINKKKKSGLKTL